MKSDFVLTRQQVRRVDQRAIEELGIPGVVLMENAAINATALIRDAVVRRLGRRLRETRITIICGGGNNGGDGYAIARHLHNRGAAVQLVATRPIDELKGDAATNAAICRHMALPITTINEASHIEQAVAAWEQSALVVDAMLGTGFSGEVRQPVATVIDRVNDASGVHVIAIDAPSGLDCETGQPAARTIWADQTITFVANKVGFLTAKARDYVGQLDVADIGVPPGLIEAARREGAQSAH